MPTAGGQELRLRSVEESRPVLGGIKQSSQLFVTSRHLLQRFTSGLRVLLGDRRLGLRRGRRLPCRRRGRCGRLRCDSLRVRQ
jgi:hypothetical protein